MDLGRGDRGGLVTLIIVIKVILTVSCSGPCADGHTECIVCLIHSSLQATSLGGGPCCDSQLMVKDTDFSGGA